MLLQKIFQSIVSSTELCIAETDIYVTNGLLVFLPKIDWTFSFFVQDMSFCFCSRWEDEIGFVIFENDTFRGFFKVYLESLRFDLDKIHCSLKKQKYCSRCITVQRFQYAIHNYFKCVFNLNFQVFLINSFQSKWRSF